MHDIENTTAKHWNRNRVAWEPGSRRSPVSEESPNAPGIRWPTPLRTPERAGHRIERAWRSPDSVTYDAVDRRLMDTFPASDAVARY